MPDGPLHGGAVLFAVNTLIFTITSREKKEKKAIAQLAGASSSWQRAASPGASTSTYRPSGQMVMLLRLRDGDEILVSEEIARTSQLLRNALEHTVSTAIPSIELDLNAVSVRQWMAGSKAGLPDNDPELFALCKCANMLDAEELFHRVTVEIAGEIKACPSRQMVRERFGLSKIRRGDEYGQEPIFTPPNGNIDDPTSQQFASVK